MVVLVPTAEEPAPLDHAGACKAYSDYRCDEGPSREAALACKSNESSWIGPGAGSPMETVCSQIVWIRVAILGSF